MPRSPRCTMGAHCAGVNERTPKITENRCPARVCVCVNKQNIPARWIEMCACEALCPLIAFPPPFLPAPKMDISSAGLRTRARVLRRASPGLAATAEFPWPIRDVFVAYDLWMHCSWLALAQMGRDRNVRKLIHFGCALFVCPRPERGTRRTPYLPWI